MRFYLSTVAATVLSMGIGANARILSSSDAYYFKQEPIGSTMWVFNSQGVHIFSDDGKELKKKIGTDFLNPAGIYEVAADGHKYVWAANMDRVEVFDIDTGDYAGYVPSCGNPAMELRYLPTREEMWMRCARSTDSEEGHIDVFSTNSLSSNHEGITLPGSVNYGWGLEAHSTLGNSGYVSPYGTNYLYEIDLSSKEILANYTFPDEVASAYDMTYSPTNKHIFGKARVCCSCGGPDKDLPNCPVSRFTGLPNPSPVIVKTGPTASTEIQNGTCGGGCEGSSADTYGVFEFDTVSKTFAANHNGVQNNGATPIVTSDGKYIVLATHDGGETVRVLKAGTNGEPSTVLTDIPTNFGGTMGAETVADMAMIEDEKRNFMVIAGWGNNEVAIVDMDDNFRMHKISLTDNPEVTAAGSRNVEWAVGTNYVWIDGQQTSEMYIVEIGDTIESARVSSLLSDIPPSYVLHVNNYARREPMIQVVETPVEVPVPVPVPVPNPVPVPAPVAAPVASPVTSVSSAFEREEAQADDSTKAIATAGLVVACVALLWSVVLTVGGGKGNSGYNSGRPTEQEQTPMDARTLGSKQAV